MPRTLDDYESTAGSEILSQLRQLAKPLKGASVVHVNSTRLGGGVAEILNWKIALMNDLGLEAAWEVVEGEGDYFNATKTFHNGLQGKPVALTEALIEAYETTVRDNAERLRSKLENADFVIIHDPQPAALIEHFPHRKGKWIWRCHIDASHPVRKVWRYLKTKVSDYDTSIFSMPEFALSMPHPQFLIAPSIDPLSEKNCGLAQEEIHQTLADLNVPTDVPIITQVSRFDWFKDPIGVIEAFKLLRETTEARLVLAGGGATDDPEGAVVYEQVLAMAEGHPEIHVLMLPGDAHRQINALQRASTIVIQKSTQEGFGLTVTEALWKGKPVIGGNVGGIRLQIHNYFNGFLVDTPEGAALRLRYLLRRPELAENMGRHGHEFVQEYFLLTRHLREYLTLMLGLDRGLSSHLIAA